MGFWKSLGKIGLKVAPYAAMAIPGVGPLAAAGIQAGIKAAQTKASGGSWKDALKGGALAAGTSYVGGKIPGLDKIPGLGKGVSPSSNFVQNSVNQVANKAGGGGFKQALGNFAKNTGKNYLAGELGIGKGGQGYPGSPGFAGGTFGGFGGQQGGGGGWQDALSGILSRFGGTPGESGDYGQGGPNLGNSRELPPYVMNYGGGGGMAVPRNDPGLDRFHQQMRRGLGPVMGQSNQNFPNLADAIGAGRMESIRNQPFRKGYDVISYGEEPEGGGEAPEIRTPMPPIYPTGGRRRQQQAAY